MTIQVADVVIDSETRTVERGGKQLRLTPREFNLLQFFAQRAERVVTRTEIRQELYTEGPGQTSNLVDVYVRYLRRKLGAPMILHTRRGRGYILGTES